MLQVKVKPAAKKTCFKAVKNHRLHVNIAAPAVGGAANQALIKFLSDEFYIKKQYVTIVMGDHAREKIIAIEQCSVAKIKTTLENLFGTHTKSDISRV